MQHSIRTLFNTILIGDEGEYNDEKFRFFPLSFCWEIERLWEMCRGKIGQYLKKKGRCSIKNKTKKKQNQMQVCILCTGCGFLYR